MSRFFLLVFTLCMLFLLSSCSKESKINSNAHFYKSVFYLNQGQGDTLTIQDVITLNNNKQFNIPLGEDVFQNITKRNPSWLHFRIDKMTEDVIFSIWNPLIKSIKLYTVSNNSIEQLNTYSLSKGNFPSYRFPTWKIENKNNAAVDVYFLVEDQMLLTCLKIMLYTVDEFVAFSKIDYTLIALQIVLLVVLTLIIVVLFIIKKEFNILWYGLYILFCTMDFMVHKGIDVQLVDYGNETWHGLKKLLLSIVGVFCLFNFFVNFYPYQKQTIIVKKIYKSIVWLTFFFSVVLIINICFNIVIIQAYIIYYILLLISLIVLPLHLYLVYKKVLPGYVGVAFTLPTIGFFIYIGYKISQGMPMYFNFIFDHLLYLSLTLEIIIMLYYIIRRFMASEFNAINLKKENLKLHNNFQDTLLQVQQDERNKLVSNMHDSFGGYLEALKLRLLHKKENTSNKIEEILDAFYKDYRYLLNSLHSPTINSTNFINNITEFCDKMNEISDQNITYTFSLDTTEVSQGKCIHIYMIISELITNAIKYSKAKDIKISLTQKESNKMVLEIIDNGIGFNFKLNQKKSYGLNNIKERVDLINGELTINTAKGEGTKVKIRI